MRFDPPAQRQARAAMCARDVSCRAQGKRGRGGSIRMRPITNHSAREMAGQQAGAQRASCRGNPVASRVGGGRGGGHRGVQGGEGAGQVLQHVGGAGDGALEPVQPALGGNQPVLPKHPAPPWAPCCARATAPGLSSRRAKVANPHSCTITKPADLREPVWQRLIDARIREEPAGIADDLASRLADTN